MLTVCLQDCLRSCQEQIESLLESSLRQAQQHSSATETKHVDEDVDLSCTPTDVRDINIWNDRQLLCTWLIEEKLQIEGWWWVGWMGGVTYLNSPASPPPSSSSRWAAMSDVPLTHTACLHLPLWDRVHPRPGLPCNNSQSHISWQWSPPVMGKEMNTREMYLREKRRKSECRWWAWAGAEVDVFPYSPKILK